MAHLLDSMLQPSHLLAFAGAGFLLFGMIEILERRSGARRDH